MTTQNNDPKALAIDFANWIRNEVNEDRLRHYDPTINGKWAYWPIGGGGIAKRLTTEELYQEYLNDKFYHSKQK